MKVADLPTNIKPDVLDGADPTSPWMTLVGELMPGDQRFARYLRRGGEVIGFSAGHQPVVDYLSTPQPSQQVKDRFSGSRNGRLLSKLRDEGYVTELGLGTKHDYLTLSPLRFVTGVVHIGYAWEGLDYAVVSMPAIGVGSSRGQSGPKIAVSAAALDMTAEHDSLRRSLRAISDRHNLGATETIEVALSAILRLAEVGYGHLDVGNLGS